MKTEFVLLIENEAQVSLHVRKLLLNAGYPNDNIIACYSVADIIKYSSARVSLVITASQLPGKDSGALFNMLKEHFSGAPIIVISDAIDNEFLIYSAQAGIHDFLLREKLNSDLLGKTIAYARERLKNDVDYRRLFSESPVPMYIYEAATYRFLAANQACLRQYGYTLEEFLSLTANDIRPGSELKAFQYISNHIPNSYMDFGQWTHCNKQGTTFVVNIFARSILFTDIPARMVTAINVERAATAEKGLQKKTEEMNSVLETVTDGFVSLDRDWNFTYINKESEKMLNLRRYDMLGRNIWALFPQSINLQFFEAYHRAMDTDQSVYFEEYSPNVKKWLSVRVYPSPAGLSIYFVDITERKKMEEQLYNETQQIKAIINNTSDAIWSVGRDGRIGIANDSFWQQASFLSNAKNSEPDVQGLEESTRELWQEYFERTLRGEAFVVVWEYEWNGNKTFFEISFNPVRDASGQIISVSCFARNTTDQRLYLQRIQAQNEKLRKIAWAQSHEIRLPVANILGLSTLLNIEKPEHSDNREILQWIVESAERLDREIKKIIDEANSDMSDLDAII